MIIYENDEYPIYVDTEKRCIDCIGYCNLCRLNGKNKTYQECVEYVFKNIERK